MHGTFSAGFSDWARSPRLGSRRCRAGAHNTHAPPRRPCITAASPQACDSRMQARTHSCNLGGTLGPAGLAALLRRCRRGPNALTGLLPPTSLFHCAATCRSRKHWVARVRLHRLRRVRMHHCATVPSPCCSRCHHRACTQSSCPPMTLRRCCLDLVHVALLRPPLVVHH
jgi:hypothetical protein